MNKLLLIVMMSLAFSVFAEKYVDLYRITIVESYSVKKMLPGKVVPKRQSILGFEVVGKVKSLKVDIGDKVSKGDLLAELEDSEARAMLDESNANLAMMDNIYQRSQSLDQANFASQQQLENAKYQFLIAQANNQRALVKFKQTKILAPYNGIIQSRFLDEGSLVNASVPVLEILDDAYVKAKVAVPRSLMQTLVIGQSYSFEIDADTVDATLMRMAPMPERGSINRLGLFEFSQFFNPGATARLVLNVTESKSGAWVPLNALSQAEQGLWTVFTQSSDNLAEQDYVELIHIENKMAFVSGTLKTGDRVIVGGASKVAQGQFIRDSQE